VPAPHGAQLREPQVRWGQQRLLQGLQELLQRLQELLKGRTPQRQA
jgi:hypothetical protein